MVDSLKRHLKLQVGLNSRNFGSNDRVDLPQESMIMLYHAYRMICLYQYLFDNNSHIGNILFEFSSYKLLASVGNNKILGSKICVNLAQA